MKHCKTCYGQGWVSTLDTRVNKTVIQRCDECMLFIDDYKAQKAYFRNKQRVITYEQFDRLYKPFKNERGNFRDFMPYKGIDANEQKILDVALKEHRVWTERYEENYVITPGPGLVNRTAVYITEKPCRLDIWVEDRCDVQTVKISSLDARDFLLKLDQFDYFFDDHWNEKEFHACSGVVKEYDNLFQFFCKKYKRRMSDEFLLIWD